MRPFMQVLLLLVILVLSILVFLLMPDRVATPNWGFWEVLIGVVAAVLGILAFLITLAGVLLYFWGRDFIEQLVERKVTEKIQFRQNEAEGTLLGFMGFIFWSLMPGNRDFIHRAIKYSQNAYKCLPEGSPFKLTTMNNLAFYLAERGYITDAPMAIKLAKELLEDYSKSGDIDWLTTYAAVVSKYYNYFDRPKQTLLDAEAMMEELLRRDDISQEHKRNAERHLGVIRSALRQLG